MLAESNVHVRCIDEPARAPKKLTFQPSQRRGAQRASMDSLRAGVGLETKSFQFSDRLAADGNATGVVESEVQVFIIAQVGSSRVDLQACKLEYSIVSPK